MIQLIGYKQKKKLYMIITKMHDGQKGLCTLWREVCLKIEKLWDLYFLITIQVIFDRFGYRKQS